MLLLSRNLYLVHLLGVVLEGDLEDVACADDLRPGLQTHAGDIQGVVGIFDIQGEVTIEVGNRGADDTVVLVALHNVGTRHHINVVRYST